jgi:hypothetical protein
VLALRVGDYLRLGSMTELLQRIILHIAKYIALDFASRPLSLDSESPIIVVQFLEVNGEQQKLHPSESVLKQNKPVQVLHASVRLW